MKTEKQIRRKLRDLEKKDIFWDTIWKAHWADALRWVLEEAKHED